MEEKVPQNKVAFDPGWNDPPTFNYNPNVEVPKVKLNLNKRIAFPMGSSPVNSGNNKPIDPTAPPSSSTNLPPPPKGTMPPAQTQEIEKNEENNFKESALEAIDYLIKVGQSVDVGSDFLNRLPNCRDQINEHSLPDQVLQHLTQIAKALKSNQFKQAEELQQFLMVNHTNKCSQWGSAIRKIIFDLEEKNRPETKDSQPEPVPQIPNLLPIDNAEPQNVEFPMNLTENQAPQNITLPTQTTNSAGQENVPENTSIFKKIKSRILHI